MARRKPGEIINLLDGTWQNFFPSVYKLYRSRTQQRDVAKIKVMNDDGIKYTLLLMEVAREEGRVFVGVGTTALVAEEQLEAAITEGRKIIEAESLNEQDLPPETEDD